MAGSEGYSVGGLKLAFNALDQTSKGFKQLKDNLSAIADLINNISTSNLRPFYTRMQSLTRIFNPFLTQIKDAANGLTVLNSTIEQVGVQNLSGIVQSFDNIRRATQGAVDEVEEVAPIIENGQRNIQQELNNTSNAQDELNEKMRRYANIQESIKKITHKDTTPKTEILREIQVLIPQLEQARNKVEQLESALQEASKQTFGNPDYAYGVAVDLERAREEYQQFANQIENLKTRFGTPFNVAQAQVAKLTQEMLNLHFATGNLDNGAIQEIRDLTSAISASQNAVKQALMSQEELVIEKYKDIQATRKQRIAYLEAELAMGASGKQARQYAKELAELRKQDGQVGKKSGFSKFLGQIKRIAIYRLIRSGLKAVTSAFKDGIGALAQFDSGINKTMSQLTTSFTVMKLSVSTALLPLLQSITPIIQQISVGFANMANVISASMSKTGYYTKINTDRLLAYNKAANVFDFDKFRALNKGDDAMNLLSTEKVEDLNKDLGVSYANYVLIGDVLKNIGAIVANIFGIVGDILKAASPIITVVLAIADAILYVVRGITWVLDKSGLLEPILYSILAVLTLIGISKIVTWIRSGNALKAIINLAKVIKTDLSNALASLTNIAKTTQGAFIAWGIAIATVTAAVKILSNWNDFSSGTKKAITAVSGLIAALGTLLTVILAVKGAFKGPAGIATAIGLGVASLAAGIVMVRGLFDKQIYQYANGGMPDKGSLFVAGESGAEFVYNMPSGQSGVANVQQIAQAVYQGSYQATMDWWKTAKNEIGGDVYLDGEQIYRNTTSHAKKHGYAWRKV